MMHRWLQLGYHLLTTSIAGYSVHFACIAVIILIFLHDEMNVSTAGENQAKQPLSKRF